MFIHVHLHTKLDRDVCLIFYIFCVVLVLIEFKEMGNLYLVATIPPFALIFICVKRLFVQSNNGGGVEVVQCFNAPCKEMKCTVNVFPPLLFILEHFHP